MGGNHRQFLGLLSLAGLGTLATGYWSQRSKESPLPANRPVARSPIAGDDLVLRFAATADGGAGDLNQQQIDQAMADWHSRYPYDLVPDRSRRSAGGVCAI
jgi:hypothetical protein